MLYFHFTENNFSFHFISSLIHGLFYQYVILFSYIWESPRFPLSVSSLIILQLKNIFCTILILLNVLALIQYPRIRDTILVSVLYALGGKKCGSCYCWMEHSIIISQDKMIENVRSGVLLISVYLFYQVLTKYMHLKLQLQYIYIQTVKLFLSLVIFFALKSTLSDTNLSHPSFLSIGVEQHILLSFPVLTSL